MSGSLDDRRPRFLRQLAGNADVKLRLSQQMRAGVVPHLAFIHGPSGAGKTTLSHILARHPFCAQRKGIGDLCGECKNCRIELEAQTAFQEFTGAKLEREWGWWEQHGHSILDRHWQVFFLDECQDLAQLHQKSLLRQLESAKAMVIFATTHINEMVDALINRFGTNVYEMRRPTPDEVADSLIPLCVDKGVVIQRAQLLRVAGHYVCDMRKCVDFVYTAAEQALEKVVTDAYLDMVLGKTPDRPGRRNVPQKL